MRPALLSLSLLAVFSAEPLFGAGSGGETLAGPLAEADRLYFHRHEGGNLEKSMSLIELRLQEDPGDPAALWRLARGLVSQAGRAGKDKERVAIYARAEDAAERAIERSPREAKGYYWKGMALGLNGKTRGMFRSMTAVGPLKRLMRKAIELDPEDPAPRHFLGEMQRQLPGFAGGSKKEAVRELEAAVRLGPNRLGAYLALARAFRDSGKLDEARRTLARALEVSAPDDPAQAEADYLEARRMLDGLKDIR